MIAPEDQHREVALAEQVAACRAGKIGGKPADDLLGLGEELASGFAHHPFPDPVPSDHAQDPAQSAVIEPLAPDAVLLGQRRSRQELVDGPAAKQAQKLRVPPQQLFPFARVPDALVDLPKVPVPMGARCRIQPGPQGLILRAPVPAFGNAQKAEQVVMVEPIDGRDLQGKKRVLGRVHIQRDDLRGIGHEHVQRPGA